jgi:hypothetical protein
MPKPRVVKPVDHDLAVWAALGGGSIAPERELSPGERIMAEANEILLDLLQSSTMRTSPVNPFRRDR